MSPSADDSRIRRLRGHKPKVDPSKAHGWLLEEERSTTGRVERALTVFLTGSECSFTCSFCDLWRFTIDGPTPAGALPKQIADTLRSVDGPVADRIKLYNASNFFDHRAVPAEDIPAIVELVAPFAGVTVESHANTIGAQTLELAHQVPGRLEVAMGLETIHPDAIAHLNKRLDLARFDRATGFLADNGIGLRVFVLLGVPYIPRRESVEYTVRAARYAADRGATRVSLIPVRGGNGELERLESLGHFTPPTLAQLETVLEQCLKFTGTVVTADLWDVELLRACEDCRLARIERIRGMNLTGRAERRVDCAVCGVA